MIPVDSLTPGRGALADHMSFPLLLLVEDSPEDVELILHSLRAVMPREQVAVANSGEEALDYLFARNSHAGRNPNEQPCAILLDLNLPRVSGLEVLRQIRAHAATRLLPVVILSASVEQRDIRAAIRQGANSYVRKSLDYARLTESMALLARYWTELNIEPPSSRRID